MDAALHVLWFSGQALCITALVAGAVLALIETESFLKWYERPPSVPPRIEPSPEPLVLPEDLRKTA